MNSSMKRGAYPYPKSRIYLSFAIAVLSTILTVHILYLEEKLIFLLYYFAATSLITAIVFVLKSSPLSIGRPKPSERTALQTGKKSSGGRRLILIFGILLALLFVPLFLAAVLDPASWFILIVSLTSGVSIAEVLHYIRTR